MFAKLLALTFRCFFSSSKHPSAGRLNHDFIDDGQTLMTQVENDSFDELEPKLSWNKGGPGLQTGGPPDDTPKGHLHWPPGGECFAPL